ncbi:hypothetical protein QAD02_001329 [Eretmocerus hayati]|uniref:Uncharacterized protein n=1 Tax=Eretmocerus hayati TaxID=131215 RepID=A0ACC2NFY7_9HYME|nr:hypothetical protein QAD02_001329 [Eretmocerus hayati]
MTSHDSLFCYLSAKLTFLALNGDPDAVNSEVIVEESKDRVEPIIDPNICGNRSSIVSPDEKQINHSGKKIDLIDIPAPSELNSPVANTAIVSQDPRNAVLYGDIPEWPASMSAMHTQVDYWVGVGNSHIQNNDVKILRSNSIVQDDHKKVRKCSPGMFVRRVKKKLFHPSWLCFSEQRIAAYEEVESILGFLRKPLNLPSEEIKTHAENVLEEYGDDLEAYLINELIQFKPFIADFLQEEKEAEQICFEAKALRILIETDTQAVFPNVIILLRTYLVMMTTNCMSGRSSSKLKLV